MRAVFYDGKKTTPVNVAPWVTFAARVVPSEQYAGYTELETWGHCERCRAERLVAAPSLPQPEAERALGTFALHHEECCENVVQRADRLARRAERLRESGVRRARQMSAPAVRDPK